MLKNISRILLVASDETQRGTALRALSRSGAQVISANNWREARERLVANRGELPGLIIMHLEYGEQEEPLHLYRQIRKNPATQTIPMILIVDTSMELLMVQRIAIDRCFCVLAPLNYGSLVFALPSLEIEIIDSILYDRTPDSPNSTSLKESETEAHSGRFNQD